MTTDGPIPSGVSDANQAAQPTGLIVTGAAGWIGRQVVANALARGLTVVAMTRRPMPLPNRAIPLACDLEQGESAICGQLEPVLAKAQSWSVVHCAGVAHVREEDYKARALLQRMNVEAVLSLVAACGVLGLRRFVQVSSIAVYAWPEGPAARPRTELDPVGPTTCYGRTKLHGEQLVEQSDLDWRVARLATVFGQGDRANFYRLAQAIKRRRFLVPGSGDQRKSCIDVGTAARALVAMALDPHLSRCILNIALPEAPTLLEVATQLALICDAPPPARMPLSILRGAAACGALASAIGLPTPLTPSDLAKLCAWTWVDAGRAAHLMPDLGQRSFAATIAAAANEYSAG